MGTLNRNGAAGGGGRGAGGMTLVELIVVIAVIAVIAMALFPLIFTTYDSWRVVDRRVEILQVGRLAMSKMVGEIRKSYDITDILNQTQNLDYYPDWATGTAFRFNYFSTGTVPMLQYGTQTPFIEDYLAGPVDDFEYIAYRRRTDLTTTRARQANSFRFIFHVSDERGILEIPVIPMEFRSYSQMRISRQGHMLSQSLGFASHTYSYNQTKKHNVCLKMFCDRTNPTAVGATGTATLDCPLCKAKGGQSSKNVPITITYVPGGDYYQGCLNTYNDLYLAPLPGKGLPTTANATIEMTITDGTETCSMNDGVYIYCEADNNPKDNICDTI